MPYSQLLMRLIFIKQRSDRGSVSSRHRPRGLRKQAVMWTELRRPGFRAGAAGGTNQPNRYVSTLSLCNANFGRG